MFLWARLALDMATAYDVRSIAEIRAQLKALPSGLDDLYERMMHQVEQKSSRDVQLAQKVLNIVVSATRPLTLAELRIALAIVPGTDAVDPENLIHNIRDIQSITGYFVAILPRGKHVEYRDLYKLEGPDEDIVQLAHLSAKEYLLKKMSSELIHIDEEKGHVEMARICLTSLLFNRDLEADGPHDENAAAGVQELLQKDPFFGYAAVHWADHYKASKAHHDHRPWSPLRSLAARLLGDHPPILQYSILQTVGNTLRNHNKALYLPVFPKNGLFTAASLLLPNVVEFILGRRKVLQQVLNRSLKISVDEVHCNRDNMTPGDMLCVVHLLLDGGADVNMVEGASPHRSVLQIACALGDRFIEVVKLLLDRGADVSKGDKNGSTPLMTAVQGSSIGIVKLLVERGAEVSASNADGRTALFIAAERDSVKVCRFLLNQDADINATGRSNYTALHVACLHSKRDNVELLLKRGADLEIPNKPWGDTALMGAIIGGDLATVRLLLDHGADINTRNSDGFTATHNAAGWGHKRILKLIVSRTKDKDVNAKDKRGRTPIQLAASRFYGKLQRDQSDCIRYLAKRGADLENHSAGFWNDTPLLSAAALGNIQEVVTLLDLGANQEAKQSQGKSASWLAIDWGRQSCLELLVKRGADLDTPHADGVTATHHAAGYGNLNILKLVVSATNKKHINAKDNKGFTPLHLAAMREKNRSRKQVACISYLVECGANIENRAESFWNDTPLLSAAARGYIEEVEALLNLGADQEAKQVLGNNAVWLAESWSRSDCLKILLGRGGNADLVNNEGMTPLIDAAKNGRIVCLKILLEHSVNIEAVFPKAGNATALWLAADSGREMVMKELLKHGANVEAQASVDSCGSVTPLLRAAMRQNVPCMLVLLEAGANVEASDSTRGHTALMVSASHGQVTAVELFLRAGAQVDSKDLKGRTALFYAAEAGKIDVCKKLLEAGADATCRDNENRTPDDVAIENGHQGICSRLAELKK